jgi:hypothetical protein
MAMNPLFNKLWPLVSGGAGAMVALRRRLGDLANEADRLRALEKTFELQAELNETVDAQLTVLREQLANLRKTVKFLLITLIATATLAAIALAAALMH